MGRQPMNGIEDMEMQTPHGDTVILEKKKDTGTCRFLCIGWIVTVVITGCIFVPIELLQVQTHYYVTIDSVSGLSNPTDGLSFNLTLGVSSWSYVTKACIKPGAFVEVSYRGVQLASSEAEVGQLCAGPRMDAERPVVATETGVPVGHVLDSLMVDTKQGTPTFDVTLHLPSQGGDSWVSGCGRQRVGAEATWCDYPNQEPTFA